MSGASGPDWAKVDEILRARLEDARDRLEGPHDINETNRIRGEIHALRAALAIPSDLSRPPMQDADSTY